MHATKGFSRGVSISRALKTWGKTNSQLRKRIAGITIMRRDCAAEDEHEDPVPEVVVDGMQLRTGLDRPPQQW